MREALLSTNEEIIHQVLNKHPVLFLDKSVNLIETGDKCALASFGRSGSTFLRMQLEKILGIHTGSDFAKGHGGPL
jgi:hypothetical protein